MNNSNISLNNRHCRTPPPPQKMFLIIVNSNNEADSNEIEHLASNYYNINLVNNDTVI